MRNIATPLGRDGTEATLTVALVDPDPHKNKRRHEQAKHQEKSACDRKELLDAH